MAQEEPIIDHDEIEAQGNSEIKGGQALVKRQPTEAATVPPQEFAPYQGAGQLELDDVQIELLTTALPDEDHDIKPTGEVFVPQVKYRAILNRVFKPGGWAMIPMSEIKAKPGKYTTLVTQKWQLVAGGKFVAEVWGEMDYNANNPNSSEATAVEGAKSNALMRACKDLGIGSECWDKTFTIRFMKDFCVQVWAPNRNGEWKNVWRRKDRPPFDREQKEPPQGVKRS